MQTLHGRSWDPFSPRDWAQTLGLAHVALFGNESGQRRERPDGDYSVLQDGRRSSCAIFAIDDPRDLILSQEPQSWSWSANLRYTIILGKKTGTLVTRRWDLPDLVKQYRIPKNRPEAVAMFERFSEAKVSRSVDVIARMLKAFRNIRAILSPRTTNALQAINVFNAFLLGTEKVRRRQISAESWCGCRKIREALELLPDLREYYISEINDTILDIQIGDILLDYLEDEPNSQCRLEPDLLIRHASGTLYQEAHMEINRGEQSLIPGHAGPLSYKGASRRDTHYTPPAFARVLVEQSIRHLVEDGRLPANLRVTDPACGSGVFLQEALRHLDDNGYQGSVTLAGTDNSDVSCAVTKFCLAIASRDSGKGINVVQEIKQADALQIDWGVADLILTNPPFGAWRKMNAADQKATDQTLRSLKHGHADKAMAFIWKAVESLKPGGVCASILPSPLLESTSGTDWRSALAEQAPPRLIGRFSGYNYFPNAMVEPGFLILQKPPLSRINPGYISLILASDGAEELALRATRSDWIESTGEERFEIYAVSADDMPPSNWMPRTRRTAEIMQKLRRSDTSTVGNLFDVKQGTLTGNNKVFVISERELSRLGLDERGFFRSAASTSTIRNCRINRDEFVFYPYSPNGPRISSEEQLRSLLRDYYERYLEPLREQLIRSGQFKPDWWQLIRPRRWQFAPTRKLVTAYFGDIGNFAYDNLGDFVVLQGYGWNWIGGNKDSQPEPFLPLLDSNDTDDEMDDGIEESSSFFDGPLPWAYVALLNSPSFRSILSLYCPRVQGGQFNLSRRFISNVPIPDLSDENRVSADAVQKLAAAGRMLSSGEGYESDDLVALTNAAYGLEIDIINKF